MKLKDIISKTLLCFTATLTENKHVAKTMAYCKLNDSWMDKFNNIVFSCNGEERLPKALAEEFANTYDITPSLLFSPENLGHSFGKLDLDRQIFEFAQKQKDIEYVIILSMDVIANASLLDIELDQSCDFFYLNNIGYNDVQQYSSKEEIVKLMMNHTYFRPQVNFYIYRNHLCEWMPNKNHIIQTKDEYINQNETELPEISEETQDLLAVDSGFPCESYLAEAVLSHELTKQNLLSEEDTIKLINFIDEYQYLNGAHKNVLFTNVGGICHYHIMNGMAMEI